MNNFGDMVGIIFDNRLFIKKYDGKSIRIIREILNISKKCDSEICKELHALRMMGYDEHLVLEWLFKPSIDYSDAFYKSMMGSIAERKDVGPGIIYVYRRPQGCIYAVHDVFIENFEDDSLAIRYIKRIGRDSENILKLLVALYDEDVQELYLDRDDSFIYIDHDKLGRCLTNIYLTHVDVEKLTTWLSLLGKGDLTRYNPSLKTEIKTPSLHLRISIDAPPLTSHTTIDIRRLRRRFMDLRQLILRGTLTPKVAGFLVFLATHRANIIICGEPDSGKTTLANALDAELPKVWRRIYVEDVVESLDLTELNVHQIKIQTSPVDLPYGRFSKDNEIIKLLHRSPDWIYLGEIQDERQVKAMFHAFGAGLRGIATIHAPSVDGLIKRWTKQYGISLRELGFIDLIVSMERFIAHNGQIIRRVSGVYGYNPEHPRFFEAVFERGKDGLKQIVDIKNTYVISRIAKQYYYDLDEVMKKISVITRRFEVMGEGYAKVAASNI